MESGIWSCLLWEHKHLHEFRLGNGSSRSITKVVFLKYEYQGLTALGEASLPPYLEETQESVLSYLKSVLAQLQLEQYQTQADWLEFVKQLPFNGPALAAIDCVWQDLHFKLRNSSFFEHSIKAVTAFTIGISESSELQEKLQEAKSFKRIKLKMGGSNDLPTLQAIKNAGFNSVIVDVNQGWKGVSELIEWEEALQSFGVELIEQPLNKADFDSIMQLKGKLSIPIIADESLQTAADLQKVALVFDGFNLKLMKCGGYTLGLDLILNAQKLNMKILLGCMTESTLGTLLALKLAPHCHWVDLDGPWMIKNDPFLAPELKMGSLYSPTGPGLGWQVKDSEFLSNSNWLILNPIS